MNDVGVVAGSTDEQVVSDARYVLTELRSAVAISWNDEIAAVRHENVVAGTADKDVASSLVDELTFGWAEQASYQHIVAGSAIKNVVCWVADDEIVQLIPSPSFRIWNHRAIAVEEIQILHIGI